MQKREEVSQQSHHKNWHPRISFIYAVRSHLPQHISLAAGKWHDSKWMPRQFAKVCMCTYKKQNGTYIIFATKHTHTLEAFFSLNFVSQAEVLPNTSTICRITCRSLSHHLKLYTLHTMQQSKFSAVGGKDIGTTGRTCPLLLHPLKYLQVFLTTANQNFAGRCHGTTDWLAMLAFLQQHPTNTNRHLDRPELCVVSLPDEMCPLCSSILEMPAAPRVGSSHHTQNIPAPCVLVQHLFC